MAFSPLDLLIAWLLDAWIGDPAWIPWPHPVVLIGRVAAALEARLRKPGDAPRRLIALGVVFWVVIAGGVAAACWALLALAGWLHPLLGRALSIYLAYACLATRCLDREARAVVALTAAGSLPEARKRLSGIVGRDTECLTEPEVLRAAMETVAENASDGVVAPLFYLVAGGALGCGPILGVVYKAVNTLDSTVGYLDERYEHFGRASARLDDLANWLPARLTALAAAASAQALWGQGSEALRIARRDGRLHKSPNAGFPEAAFAGALGVELGGVNAYRGILRASPKLGDPGPPLTPAHAFRALKLLWAVSGLVAAIGMVLLL